MGLYLFIRFRGKRIEISQMEDSWVADLIQIAVVFIISIILIKHKEK